MEHIDETQQQLLELQRQEQKLRKQLHQFKELKVLLQQIEQDAQRGDANAAQKMQRLEKMINGGLMQDLQKFADKLEALEKQHLRLQKMQQRKTPVYGSETNKASKIVKRRNRTKYM